MGEELEQRWSFYSIEDTIEALKVYFLNVPCTTWKKKRKNSFQELKHAVETDDRVNILPILNGCRCLQDWNKLTLIRLFYYFCLI